MVSNNALRPRPDPLPDTIEEWERKSDYRRTLNDMVEELHRSLYNQSDEYQKFLEAVWDEDAVEGSLAADNIKAAEMIRTAARTLHGNDAANKKLATIAKSLGVVLRRYSNSRKERRNMVGGKVVPNENEE